MTHQDFIKVIQCLKAYVCILQRKKQESFLFLVVYYIYPRLVQHQNIGLMDYIYVVYNTNVSDWLGGGFCTKWLPKHLKHKQGVHRIVLFLSFI